MKPFNFLIAVLFILSNVNCKKEEPKCVFNHIVPSKFKDYVPYKDGDQVVFKATSGQLDTLIVSEIKFDSFPGSRHDCPNVYEKVHCTISTNWKDSSGMNVNQTITIFDYVVTPNTKIITVDGGEFQATDFGGGSNADINLLQKIAVDGITYSDVLLANCRNPIECSFIDSMCFVKNHGLIFYSIYGKKWVKI